MLAAIDAIAEDYDPETKQDDQESDQSEGDSEEDREEDPETQIQRLERELSSAKEENSDLRRDMSKLEDRISELERDKDSAERTIRLLKVENQSLNAFIELNKGGDGLLKLGDDSRPQTASASRPGTAKIHRSARGYLEGSVTQGSAVHEPSDLGQTTSAVASDHNENEMLVHAYLDEIVRLKSILEKKGITDAEIDGEDSHSSASVDNKKTKRPQKLSKSSLDSDQLNPPTDTDLKATEGLDESELIKKKQ